MERQGLVRVIRGGACSLLGGRPQARVRVSRRRRLGTQGPFVAFQRGPASGSASLRPATSGLEGSLAWQLPSTTPPSVRIRNCRPPTNTRTARTSGSCRWSGSRPSQRKGRCGRRACTPTRTRPRSCGTPSRCVAFTPPFPTLTIDHCTFARNGRYALGDSRQHGWIRRWRNGQTITRPEIRNKSVQEALQNMPIQARIRQSAPGHTRSRTVIKEAVRTGATRTPGCHCLSEGGCGKGSGRLPIS